MTNEATIIMVIFRVFIRALGIISVPLRLRQGSPAEKTYTVSTLRLYLGYVNYMTISGETLTFVLTPVHLAVDFNQDTCIAQTHDEQREHIKRDKVKHVVCRFLPVLLKAAVCSALDKVDTFGLNCPENEQLSHGDKNENVLISRDE